MHKRRMNHCSVIIRDHLFIFFGYEENNVKKSNTLEWLDLRDPYAGSQIMNIGYYDSDVVEPMIIHDTQLISDENSKESKVLYIGGNQP